MMLELGVVLLFKPGLLNNVTTGLVLLVIAILITLIARRFAKVNTE